MSDNTEQMAPTPRCDEVTRKLGFVNNEGEVEIVSADFARQLERELAKAKTSLDKALKELTYSIDRYKYTDGLLTTERAAREQAEARLAIRFPVELNTEQESTVKQWAVDDRLWTTQETVEFNLRTFARKIISLIQTQ